MKRVSFDFDGTLTEPKVLRFAHELRRQDCEIWITTLRHSNESLASLRTPKFYDNEDLYKLAYALDISHEHIQFCNETGYKLEYLIDKNFRFHLDDDHFMVYQIGLQLPHIIVDYYDPNWKIKCLERLVD